MTYLYEKHVRIINIVQALHWIIRAMTNRYYRYLDLPFEFNPIEPDFSLNHHVKYDLQPHGEFVDWLDQLNITVGFAEVFKKYPSSSVQPWSTHLDGEIFDDHVKINFVQGHGTSKMIWAKIKQGYEHTKRTTVVNTNYLCAPLEHCDIVASDPLWQPAVINAGLLHNIIDVSEPRICYSFMLRHKNSWRRLLWDDAMTLFKDYLK